MNGKAQTKAAPAGAQPAVFPYLSLFFVALIAGAFYLAYADTFSELWHYWNEGQNWQFLIPLAFLYMLWDRKDLYAHLEARPALIAGSALLALSLAVLVAGQVSFTHSLREISVVMSVFALVLLLFGWRHVRALFWPLAYLVLMTSIPTDLLTILSDHLKLVSAIVGAQVLEWFGYAVYRETNVLYLPHITLVVADECSGLNQLMSAIALGIPIAFTMVDRWWKRIVILFMSCLFGIMANWLRVVLIALWHYDSAKEQIHGPQEIYQLPFIFLIGVFLTFLFALAMAEKRSPGSGREGSAAGSLHLSPRASMIALAMLSLSALYLWSWHVQPVEPRQPVAGFPLQLAGFSGQTEKEPDKPFHGGLAQEEFFATYTGPDGRPVQLLIAYFTEQNAEQELVDYRYNWLHENARAIDVPAGNLNVTMKKALIDTPSGKATAYFVYDVNDRQLVDLKRIKLASLSDALLHRRSNGAIAVVVFDGDISTLSADQARFLEQVLLELDTFL